MAIRIKRAMGATLTLTLSQREREGWDCFVTSLLAMTG
jgi:hypothetical protein